MSQTPAFYVGSARWTRSLTAVVDVLRQQLARPRRNLPMLLARSYGTPHDLGPQWRALLATAQDGRCFWCGQPMTSHTATLEHVLPYQGPWWPRLSRLEQLLSLRLSHAVCNRAYRTWREGQHAARLTHMDQMLVRHIQRIIAAQPLLQLYEGGQYHPDRPASSG